MIFKTSMQETQNKLAEGNLFFAMKSASFFQSGKTTAGQKDVAWKEIIA